MTFELRGARRRLGLAVLCLSLAACARVDGDLASGADAGATPVPPRVLSVDPTPGTVEAQTTVFTVLFSAPMDPVQLLAGDRSETVVLVAEPDATELAAALARPHLTARERARLVPARAALRQGGAAVELALDGPLAPGSYFLLVSSRLHDETGRKLAGHAAQFGYDVTAPPLAPILDAPLAGWEAPRNLRRVRVSFPPGFDGGQVSLLSDSAGAVAGPVDADGGPLVLEIAGEDSCGGLCPGARYTLGVDGVPVPSETFTVGSCQRTVPPALDGGLAFEVRDRAVSVAVQLDWPALVQLEAAALDGGLVASDCKDCSLRAAALVRCAPRACPGAPAIDGGVCQASLRLRGLAPATAYGLRLVAEDDEGHRFESTTELTTDEARPGVVLSEVMARPPLPAPRSAGEYLELQNLADAPVDLRALSLRGPDGHVRPVCAADDCGLGTGASTLLRPGGRALAVGSSFDAARYRLPAGLVVARGKTKRLLARGLGGKTPVAVELLWRAQDAAQPVVLERFPGPGPSCSEGASVVRDPATPSGEAASWRCGPVGGAPGQPK